MLELGYLYSISQFDSVGGGMEEESCSWVTRPKFSHTAFARSKSSREQIAPYCVQSDRESKKRGPNRAKTIPTVGLPPSSPDVDSGFNPKSLKKREPKPISFSAELKTAELSLDSSTLLHRRLKHSDRHPGFESKRISSSSPALSSLDVTDPKLELEEKDEVKDGKNSCGEHSDFSFFPNGGSGSREEEFDFCNASTPMRIGRDPESRVTSNSKSKRRSLSPSPARIISDVFKEAKSLRKRFSTPPPTPRMNGRSRSPTSREMDDTFQQPSTRDSEKKNKKDSSWMKYFDNGAGRVSAVETTEEWTVDLSKLYLGQRFDGGAHSRIYHGMYKDQHVAVKIIRQPDDDEDRALASRLEKQFMREVTHLSHLCHRNVIKLAGVCKKPPVFFVITEYLAGGSLRSFLHKRRKTSLPLDTLVTISLDIARGMEYIHSKRIVHRDLKPENILFDKEFCVKIADFGIACEEAYCDKLAEDPGTYRWMAPEMIKHKPYGRKVDVYSFGLLVWEMLTGTVPYEEMIPIQAAFAVVNKNLRPVVPTDCPMALGTLIEQCWAIHPETRPEFSQIVKILEQFESALIRDGTLDKLQNLTCQDQKKRNPKPKLKPLHVDSVGPLMPKLL